MRPCVPDLTQGQRVTSAIKAITKGDVARLFATGSKMLDGIQDAQLNLNFR